MSTRQRAQAETDYQQLHAHPAQLAQKMEQHQDDQFYLAEIVELATAAGHWQDLVATGKTGILGAAQHSHRTIQSVRAQYKSSKGKWSNEWQDVQGLGWGSFELEAYLVEMHRGSSLESFGNHVPMEVRSALGIAVGKGVHAGEIPASAVVAFTGTAWDAPKPIAGQNEVHQASITMANITPGFTP